MYKKKVSYSNGWKLFSQTNQAKNDHEMDTKRISVNKKKNKNKKL